MIHVSLPNREELGRWYSGILLPYLRERSIPSGGKVPPLLQALFDHLNALTDAETEDILLLPRRETEERYGWAREYGTLCDFCAAYGEFREREKNAASRSQLQKDREAYLEEHRCALLDSAQTDGAAKSWAAMDALQKRAAAVLAEANRGIKEKFDYAFLDKLHIRGELAARINVPVCPYCNKQYIQPVTIGKDRKYLGDLDHIRPKSVYQLYSLSLWNLTPGCKACNQMFKGDSTRRILNPYEAGFDEAVVLKLRFANAQSMAGEAEIADMAWTPVPEAEEDTRRMAENNIALFCLNETYDYHKRDIQLALKRRYLTESQGYRESVAQLMGPLSVGERNRLAYGVSLEPAKFQEELLSKAIYDAVKRN